MSPPPGIPPNVGGSVVCGVGEGVHLCWERLEGGKGGQAAASWCALTC